PFRLSRKWPAGLSDLKPSETRRILPTPDSTAPPLRARLHRAIADLRRAFAAAVRVSPSRPPSASSPLPSSSAAAVRLIPVAVVRLAICLGVRASSSSPPSALSPPSSTAAVLLAVCAAVLIAVPPASHHVDPDRQRDMDDQLMEQVDSEISAAPAENQGEMSMITQKSRGYVPWNDEMDKVLLDTFVEHFNKGDRCQNGWKPHVYTAAVKNVREKCNVNITKSNIDSRSKTFDKHYHVISGLLSTSGFGWDWDKNKLKVDSDSVWDDYV
ncbi:hypothetical protein EJB05_13913, partial [Eragrostis curvula]